MPDKRQRADTLTARPIPPYQLRVAQRTSRAGAASRSLHMIVARLLEALFPPACAGCGRPGSALCTACVPPRGRSVPLLAGDVPVTAVGRYAGSLRRAILAFKRGRRDVGDMLGELLAERCGPLPAGVVLVPVPTTRRRRGERGYDQSVCLAKTLGVRHGRPVLVALVQSKGDAQRGRSRSARLSASGRFTCAASSVVEGVTVVLVDDVVTTGATLRDCAQCLRLGGARVVGALVLAYA